MSEIKKYKVSVFGETLSLVSDESEEHVKEVAAVVDGFMRQLADRAGITDPRRIALLAALHYAHHHKQLQSMVDEYQNREQQLAEHIDACLCFIAAQGAQ